MIICIILLLWNGYVTIMNQAPVIKGLGDVTITVGAGKEFAFEESEKISIGLLWFWLM